MQQPSHISRRAVFFSFVSHSIAMACIAIAFMLLARGITFYQFQDAAEKNDLLPLMWYSIRWDLKLLSTLILLNLLVLTPIIIKKNNSAALKTTNTINHLFLIIICSLSFIHIIYWESIGQPFDIFIFGLLDDETHAIIELFVDQYNPFRNSLILIAMGCLAIFIQKKTHNTIMHQLTRAKFHCINNKLIIFTIILLFVLVLALSARGSTSLFPLNKKTTHFSSSMFMNNLAINAPNHLLYAFKEKNNDNIATNPHKQLAARGFKSIEDAAKNLLFVGEKTASGSPLVFTSKANHDQPLPNVVFVMMESWSSQILLADSAEQDLLGSFREHENTGALFTNFLSTRLGTNRFIESTLLNTSILNISTSSAKNHQFQYSNLKPFLEQGYDIAFVSGGARTWLNHDIFWKKQGVHHYWDMSDIMSAYQIQKHSDWGVHDEYTYRFAQEKLTALSQQGKPVFMFIITTSNHPPHSTPEGYNSPLYDLSSFREHLIQPKNAQNQLSTFRYATDQLGLFLKALKKSSLGEQTIALATGDHVLRSFFQFSHPNHKLLAGAVPFYIQVPPKYMQDKTWDTSVPTSHRDIFPTLFELALPNARYLKTGFNLLDTTEPKGAWYEHHIWMVKNSVSFDNPNTAFEFDAHLNVTKEIPVTDDMQHYKKHVQAVEAILEWQVINELKTADD